MFSLWNLELKVWFYKVNDDYYKIENLIREKKRLCVIVWYFFFKKIDGCVLVLY